MSQRGFQGRVIVGAMLVIIGLLLFAQNFDPFQELIPEFVYQWQVIFIVMGVLFLFLSKNKTLGIIFIAIGLFNLYPELWPLIFVLFGLFIIFGVRGKNFFRANLSFDSASKNSSDFIEEVSIFGGGTKVFTTNNFKGGSIVSIFGGSEINLTNSKLADGDNTLEFVAIFGGSTIIVPSNWKITTDILPIFGGFSDKRRRDPNIEYDQTKTLTIKGLALFGGGEVKTIF